MAYKKTSSLMKILTLLIILLDFNTLRKFWHLIFIDRALPSCLFSMYMFNNPIIRGFNPDPSIIQVRDKYYIATSTFEFFPGVSLYVSKDLQNWEYHSSILTRESQLDLTDCQNSKGIYAPTIREHKGRIYLVTTNKNTGWNFICHIDDIDSRSWSEISLIRKGGIDPSIYFEEDSCFYTSNGLVDNKRGILGFFINPNNGEKLSEEVLLTQGLTGVATEAPHIFKRNNYYYLIVAEGGTEYGHHEVVFRATSLLGEYKPLLEPILSHVNCKNSKLQATGHADLLQLANGDWIAVFLAIRMRGKALLHNLGRETFLSPVTWVDDWPIIGNKGTISDDYQVVHKTIVVDFKKKLESYPLLKVKKRKDLNYLQYKAKGILCLKDENSYYPTLLAIRQTEFCSLFQAKIDLASLTGRAGICAWYNDDYNYKIELTGNKASLIMTIHSISATISTIELKKQEKPLLLTIKSDENYYYFYVNDELLGKLSYAGLCTEGTMYMTFTGTLLGLYAKDGSATFVDSFSLIT